MDQASDRRMLMVGTFAVAVIIVVAIVVVALPRLGTRPLPTAGPVSPSAQPEGAAVLIAAGDIAGCASEKDEETARVVEGYAGTVAALGDLAYERGTIREFRDCYEPTWGRFKDRTRPVPGNHEYETPGAAGYFEYFGPTYGTPPTSWYAYDLGAWRIYALDSNCAAVDGCGPASPQGAWLTADLAANPRECSLAYWHHGRFSSGRHGSNPSIAPLWNAMVGGGAELVLQSHDHLYERVAPLDVNGQPDEVTGTRSFTVGTGGRSFYEFHGVVSGSEVRDNATHGVLVLTLRDGGYDWRFVSVPGESFTDSGSGTCR